MEVTKPTIFPFKKKSESKTQTEQIKRQNAQRLTVKNVVSPSVKLSETKAYAGSLFCTNILGDNTCYTMS